MEEAQKYREQFLEIAGEIELNLSLLLEEWDEFLQSRDGLDDLFRMIHSLKSGAAFLELRELEEKAHSAEDSIELYRKEEKDGALLKQRLEEVLDNLDLRDALRETGPEQFTPHELALIDEAGRRGETVYRITCVIDPAEPMKKARAFLIQNNLELIYNVIKASPSLREEADFSRFTVYLSTSDKRSSLRRAVDVDRINEIRIDTYSRNDDDIGEEPEVIQLNESSFRHPIRVEKDRLEEIRIYLNEIRRYAAAGTRNSRKRLLEMTDGIELVLRSFLYEDLITLGRGVGLYLEKLCSRYGKKISLSVEGNNLLLSMSQIAPLTEIFQQLVRNSLTHGIEKEGTITIKGSRSEGKRIIRFSDSGKGLDWDTLREKAGEENVLSLLCRSGFSTLAQADTLSGRGIGLNLVKHNTENMGGRLILDESDADAGLTLIMELPEKDTVSVLQFRQNDKIAALPLSFVKEEKELDKKRLKRNRAYSYFYRCGDSHLPLYEIDGPVKSLDAMRKASFVIIINYLKKGYAFLADELLLEQSLPDGELANLLYIDPAHLEDTLG